MYNPFAKDQIGANVVATWTGVKAAEQGHDAVSAFNVGMGWRHWYKNLTLFAFVTPVTVIGSFYGYPWVGPAQVLVCLFVFGVTYVSLVDQSGFQQRWWYRVWSPVARLFPNVSRIWWYLLLFAPVWAVMYARFAFYVGAPTLVH
jgi:hypothetical protein